MKYSICSPWEFTEQWSEDFLNFRLPAQQVALPHTCKEVPLHFADSHHFSNTFKKQTGISPMEYRMKTGLN